MITQRKGILYQRITKGPRNGYSHQEIFRKSRSRLVREFNLLFSSHLRLNDFVNFDYERSFSK